MKRLIFTILFVLLFKATALAQTTYNYYVSDDATGNAEGSDSNDGSIGTPFKSLDKVDDMINAANSDDTVNVYLDRGDTWTENSAEVAENNVLGIWVSSTDPEVNITAYGSGDLPCIDGGVTDFSDPGVPSHAYPGGPFQWVTPFRFHRTDCSVRYVEIKRWYGWAIYVDGSGTKNFTLEYCDIHHIGGSNMVSVDETDGAIIRYNKIYVGGQLHRYNNFSSYGAAIMCRGWNGASDNSLIAYNTVYNMYGEGIQMHGGVCQYNIVGDTGSVGIYWNGKKQPWLISESSVIYRYNLVYSSGSNDYRSVSTSACLGIGAMDESNNTAARQHGDNTNCNIEIYGNIVINRHVGIFGKVQYPDEIYTTTDIRLQSLKIYNNLVIDSHGGGANYYLDHIDKLTSDGYFYNNSSVFYDQTGTQHIEQNSETYTSWTISDNHYYGNGLTDCATDIDSDFNTNCEHGDPKIPGEALGTPIDWDGMVAAFPAPTSGGVTLDFDLHLYPPSDSGLLSVGIDPGVGFDATLLTATTDWDTGPGIDNPVTEETDVNSSNWEIGPFAADFGGPTISSITPTGTISCTVDPRSVTMEWSTDETCNCRIDTVNQDYDLMPADSVWTTDGEYHADIESLACGQGITRYVGCEDAYGNESSIATISFTIGSGTPPAAESIPSSSLGGGYSGGGIN